MRSEKSRKRTAKRKALRLMKSKKHKGNSGNEPEARRKAAEIAHKLHLERYAKDPFYNVAKSN